MSKYVFGSNPIRHVYIYYILLKGPVTIYHLAKLCKPDTITTLTINDHKLSVLPKSNVFLKEKVGVWEVSNVPSLKEKGPHRNGGFKDAFRNNVVFVYATKGTNYENEWYYNKARFDAETFWYRANGAIEIIKDIESLDTERNQALTALKNLLNGQ